MKLPRDVECTWCGAAPGHGCHARYNPYRNAITHRARWKAIGIDKPTEHQELADEKDGINRDWTFREGMFRKWRERTP